METPLHNVSYAVWDEWGHWAGTAAAEEGDPSTETTPGVQGAGLGCRPQPQPELGRSSAPCLLGPGDPQVPGMGQRGDGAKTSGHTRGPKLAECSGTPRTVSQACSLTPQ